jgi:hypothetical protein
MKMNKHNEIKILAVILLIFAIVASLSALTALMSPQKKAVSAAPGISIASGLWSSPGTWSNGQLPSNGTAVMIAAGTTVTYDLNDNTWYESIDVNGKLTFAIDRTTSLTISYGNLTIMPGGVLEIGTRDAPIESSYTATIKLHAAPNQYPVIVSMGGRIEIHGSPVQYTFTNLAADAPAGSNTITVTDPVSWTPGSHVVITSTSFDPYETEDANVSSVNGNTITLTAPLQFTHNGTDPTRAQVGILTRNVVITSDPSNPPGARGVGVAYMPSSTGSLSYVEFSHLGVQGVLGKYPVHFHHVKHGMAGALIEGLSIWDSLNRFMAVHDTDGLIIKDCVGYESIGHGFFLEDGDETGNVFVHNLGVLVKTGTLRISDQSPAVFWTSNPYNRWIQNYAVGSEGDGFGFLIGQDERMPSMNQNPDPLTLPILEFTGDVSHSNYGSGISTYPLNQGDASNPGGGSQVTRLTDVVAWGNSYYGMSLTANLVQVRGAQIFANGYGDMLATGDNITVQDSKLLGSTIGPSVQTTNGIVLDGTNFTLKQSTLAGHTTNGNITGSDFIVLSSTRTLITAVISDTVMQSQRTIIFGYPPDANSVIHVKDYNLTDKNFDLRRIDLNLGPGWTANQFFEALMHTT